MDEPVSAATPQSSSPPSSPPSSPLSVLSNSPSPPPSSPLLPSPLLLALDPSTRYPSPTATSPSGSSSPRKPSDPEMAAEHHPRGDGPPPAKRRRVQQPPRTRRTHHINLSNLSEEDDVELDYLLQALRRKKRIVVIAGAGISVSAGIPDFRSSTGLFTTLRGQHGLRGSGKHLFDASVYKHDSSTTSFHSMVRELAHMTQKAKPTTFHHMLASIAHEGRLMRLYSQNVDGIDTSLPPLATRVPLNAKGPWPTTIQLHGGLAKMVCSKCGQLEDFDGSLFDGPEPPPCQQCTELDNLRTELAGKRSHGIGRLRPRIVLYNEYNPDEEAIGNVSKADLRRGADAVIVVGTSLKIPGVRRLVKELCQVTRSRRDGLTAWINVDAEPQGAEFKDCFDHIVRGSCDDIASLAGLPHWDQQDIGSPTQWTVESGVEEKHRKLDVEVVLDEKNFKVKSEGKKQSRLDKIPLPVAKGVMPTPTSSPKPRRTRLPDKPITGRDKQSKLAFHQVKGAVASVAASKELSKSCSKDSLNKAPGAKTKRPRQPPKAKATITSHSLTQTFRATKLAAQDTLVAGKARKSLPSGKISPSPSVGGAETARPSTPSMNHSAKRKFPVDLSKLPSLRDGSTPNTSTSTSSLFLAEKENDYDSAASVCHSLDKARDHDHDHDHDHNQPRTPPLSQHSRRPSDATITPNSLPRNMEHLITLEGS